MFGFNSPAPKKLFGAEWIAKNEIIEISVNIKII
jgi:hypothetical protein